MKVPDDTLDQLRAVYHIIQLHLKEVQVDDAVALLVRRACNSARRQDDGLPLALLPLWSYEASGGKACLDGALTIAAA
jgi:hypothetical protein